MTWRPRTPHTPPPTSRVGEKLRGSLFERAGLVLDWRVRSTDGLVHYVGGWAEDGLASKPRTQHPWTECNAEPPFEDTLADVTCFWCIAGKEQQ